jgi:ATP-dependent helicase HrpA
LILQMAALKLGDVDQFPFLDPPDARSIRDGVGLLQELGAFDSGGGLTDVGRRLARLPLDPRIGRMILAAEQENCVREVLVLAAALSIPDPRERPVDREEAAPAEACPVRRRELRFHLLPEPVALSARAAQGALRQRLPADVPR